MYFHTYALIVVYCMASLGLFSASLVETIETPFIVSVGTAVFISLIFNIKKRKRPLPPYLWTIAAVVIFLIFVLEYLNASSSIITSASRFLAILLALKLFDMNRDRDYIIVYSIVFFQILACAASTVSPLFFLILFFFTAGSIWAMIIYSLRKDLQESLRFNPTGPPVAFGMRFFVTVMATSAVSIMIALMLFLILPRTGIGLFDIRTLNSLKLTGFSERVAPGVMGPLKKDPTVVMRVQPRGIRDVARLRRLRGVSLDRFDGTAWTRSIKDSVVVRSGPGGTFAVGRPTPSMMELEIMIEPTDSDVIFAPPNPVRLAGRFSNIWLDPSGGMRLPSAPFSRVDYRVWSSASPVPDNGRVRAEYLDASFMGDGPFAKRITALLNGILGGKENDMEKARAIEAHLKTQYSYSLDPRRGAGVNPVDDFLFYSKEGYCEHYASAMAALLRGAGIPSRVVTGFLPGEWNGYGNYFIVREQDAHSWVEAYIKGSGWTTFDPTPDAGVAPVSNTSTLALYMDFLRLRWNRHIIHFSLSDQRRLAHGVEESSYRLYTLLRSTASGVRAPAGAKALIPYVLAIAALLAMVLLRSAFRGRAGQSKAPEFYLEMVRLLKKKGLCRMRGETPLEFAVRTGDPLVMEVTAFFQTERYGCRALSGYDLVRARMAVEALKKGSSPGLFPS